MNREEIIRMAREVGFKVDWQHADVAEIKAKRYEYFASLVAAAEREACAVIAETPISGEQDDITMEAKDRAAAAIRARGNT
jgi:hypothetical protein